MEKRATFLTLAISASVASPFPADLSPREQPTPVDRVLVCLRFHQTELPVAEQFKTTLQGKKLVTVVNEST